jgi:hypothetical protein
MLNYIHAFYQIIGKREEGVEIKILGTTIHGIAKRKLALMSALGQVYSP